jgi:hypothetical protein
LSSDLTCEHCYCCRAWEVMQEVGLRDALHHLVRAPSSTCRPTDTTSAPTVKVLSTLQRKRLLIGLELLRAPSVLFCPEVSFIPPRHRAFADEFCSC